MYLFRVLPGRLHLREAVRALMAVPAVPAALEVQAVPAVWAVQVPQVAVRLYFRRAVC